jgi:hypothetical protein
MPGTRPGMTEIVATILAHSSSEIVSEQHATNAITALAACDISYECCPLSNAKVRHQRLARANRSRSSLDIDLAA